MKKLTAEKCREMIDDLRDLQNRCIISINGEKYLQALEIALPVLEQQEKICQMCNGTGEMDSGGTQPWGDAVMITCECQNPTDTYRQIENDAWVEWGGGECPVNLDTRVEVKFRNGETNSRQRGNDWAWQRTNDIPGDFDIIAYRVIENDGREG